MALRHQKVNTHSLLTVIDRPDARNAVDFDVIYELEQTLDRIEDDPDIYIWILRGAGEQSFISGGDLKKFHSIQSKDEAFEMSERMHDCLKRMEALPCWSVAAINGDAYGGGIEIMLSCDFRVARPGVSFGLTQGRFYLTPGWGGLTRLVHTVGKAKALQWLARAEIINESEALNHNLIHEVLPVKKDFDQAVLEWCRPLSKNDRTFIKTLKSGVKRAMPNDDALEAEKGPFSELWADPEHLKRVEAFLSKKK